MDKRTKILLGVLGVLALLAAGYFGFIVMTAEDMGEMAAVPVTGKVAEAPKPAEQEAAPGNQPGPAPAVPATAGAPAAETQATATPSSTAVPAPTGKEAAKAAPAPAGAPAPPAGKEAVKPAASPCVTVFKITVKGKETKYNTPEDVVEKSGMNAAALKAYSAKNKSEATKAIETLKKTKGPADAIDCASKNLALAEKLVSLVAAKFPEKAEQKVYTYSSLDKRDPFMSPMEIPKVFPKIPATAPPVQQVPSEQLRVSAIIWNDKGYRAMITTPDNRAYTVRVGDTIGNKKGKVDRITEKRVYIKELIPDIFGDIETREIVLKLYKETELP